MQNLIIVGFLLLLPSLALGQSKGSQPPPEQATYSESSPYIPRKLVYTKAKSDKKTAKDTPSTAAPVDNPTEATQTGAVSIEIPIFVFDQANKPIKGLPKDAFKLYVDGQEQAVEELDSKEFPSNFILVLDTSGSTTSELKDIQHFASELVATLAPQNKVKLLAFDQKVTILSDFTTDQEVLQKAIKKLKSGEGTSLYEMLENVLRNQTGASDGPATILLLTDGVDTTSKKAGYESSLKMAEGANATVFPWYLDTYKTMSTKPIISSNTGLMSRVAGIIINQNTAQQARGLQTDYELGQAYLLDLASLSGGRVIRINNLKEVNKASLESLSEVFKPTYYLRFSVPLKAGTENRTQLKVRVNRPNLNIHTFGSRIVSANR